MHRCCVFVLLIQLIMACNLDDPANYNGGLVCLLKWMHKPKGDLEGTDELQFPRFDRSNFEENGDPQENWLDSENRKLLSLRSARLIRELGRKRGSLEKNFLRFGRSLEAGNDVNTKRETPTLDDSHMRYLKSDQLDQNKPVPVSKRNKLENNFLRFGRWKTENLNEQFE